MVSGANRREVREGAAGLGEGIVAVGSSLIDVFAASAVRARQDTLIL